MWAKQKQSGFTIVELLIVVVVIAILASISIVTFNGVQKRARDANVGAVSNQIQKSIVLWHLDTGLLPAAGWGSTGAAVNNACPGNTTSSGGWLQSGAYLCTMQDLLKTKGYMNSDLSAKLPKNTVTGSSGEVFMFYSCGTNRSILMWSLESPSAAETTNYSSNLTTCGLGTTFTDNYGMRASALISF